MTDSVAQRLPFGACISPPAASSCISGPRRTVTRSPLDAPPAPALPLFFALAPFAAAQGLSPEEAVKRMKLPDGLLGAAASPPSR